MIAAELLGRLHLGAVDARDHIAAGRIADPGDRGRAGRGLQPCVRGTRAGLDLRHSDAGRFAEGAGEARRNRPGVDSEKRVLHSADGDQLRGHALDGSRRDRESDAFVPAAVALDLRVDADHLAVEVEERPTRVAVVDRGVGLDRVLDRRRVGRRDLTSHRADDAARDGVGRAGTGRRSRRRRHRPGRSSSRRTTAGAGGSQAR